MAATVTNVKSGNKAWAQGDKELFNFSSCLWTWKKYTSTCMPKKSVNNLQFHVHFLARSWLKELHYSQKFPQKIRRLSRHDGTTRIANKCNKGTNPPSMQVNAITIEINGLLPTYEYFFVCANNKQQLTTYFIDIFLHRNFWHYSLLILPAYMHIQQAQKQTKRKFFGKRH